MHPAVKKIKLILEANKAATALNLHNDLGPMIHFNPGKLIEVLWVITPEEDGDNEEADKKAGEPEAAKSQAVAEKEEIIWWGATIVGRSSNKHKFEEGEGENPQITEVPIYEIMYDARPPEFPEQERSEICVVDEHELFDVGAGSQLPWRFKGDTWEAAAEVEKAPEQTAAVEQAATSSAPAENHETPRLPAKLEALKTIVEEAAKTADN